MPAPDLLPERAPHPGELVQVRSRRWLVEETTDAQPGESARVSLACADDDNQGAPLTVFWDHEPAHPNLLRGLAHRTQALFAPSAP